MIDDHITFSHTIKGLVCGGKFIPKPKKIEVRYSQSKIGTDTVSLSDNSTCMIHVRADDLRNILKDYEDDGNGGEK